MSEPALPRQSQAYRHENALKWIRLITGLHYFGDAFNPEHMRDLANIAADALAGTKDLPDFEESQEKSRERAAEMAEFFSAMFARDEADEKRREQEAERGA